MKENINDIIRNKISEKFYSKNSEEFDQKIDEFFCEIQMKELIRAMCI